MPVDRQVDWQELLRPDDTPRATPSQRGFTRSEVSKHFPNNRAPRSDYASVGQCQRILEHFGKNSAELTEKGRSSWGLWWLIVGILTVLTVLFAAIPGIGGVFPLVGIIVIVHHFWTRRKLEPPFSQK